MAVRLLAEGIEAARRIAAILPEASRLRPGTSRDQFGTPFELAPLTVYRGNRLYLGDFGYGVVYCTFDARVGDRLYEQPLAEFIRDEYLIALGEGAARAAWIIPLYRLEMTFAMALVAPMWAMVVMGAAKTLIFYVNHQNEVDQAFDVLPKVIREMIWIREHAPEYFDRVMSFVARELIRSIPDGITSEDVAYFLGRLIHGFSELGSVAADSVGRTVLNRAAILGAIRVLVVTSAVFTALHAPSMAVHGVRSTVERIVSDFRQQLGVSLTHDQATRILRELSQTGVLQKLATLKDLLDQIVPLATTLGQAANDANAVP
jgi:hypothetical protein